MQFSCRNFGTLLSTSLRSFRMLEPNIFQKVAPDLARQLGERHNNHPCCQNDTKCHSWRDETELCRVRTAGWGSDADSGRVDGSGVHQHDRDAVLDRVDAAALAAFQAFAVCSPFTPTFAPRLLRHPLPRPAASCKPGTPARRADPAKSWLNHCKATRRKAALPKTVQPNRIS